MTLIRDAKMKAEGRGREYTFGIGSISGLWALFTRRDLCCVGLCCVGLG